MKHIKGISSPLFEIYYFCIAAFLAIIYTYPLIINPTTMFYGFKWDPLAGIWFFWWLKFSYIHELPLKIFSYIAYPFGCDFSNNPFSYVLNFIAFLLTYFTNEVAAYNILKLISFPILALTTYFLVHYLTKERVISAVIGLVYAFSPFHIIHNMAHFTNVYWTPLVILFLLKLLKEGGYKNGILFGLFMGLAFVDYAYYAYFIGLLIPVFIIAYLLNKDKRANILSAAFLKVSFIGFLVFCLVSLPMLYPILKGAFFTANKKASDIYGLVRDFSDLFIWSAKPLDYILPSKHNPFLGWLVPDFGMSPFKGHRYTDHTLYLGYSLIFAGGYAFYCAVRKIGQLDKDRQTVYLFFAIAIVAAILSAPPFIPLGKYHIDIQTREIFADYKIYLPQYFLYKLFPMFRVYARMGVIVLLAVCILAAFGLREILTMINSKSGKVLFLSLFLLIVFIEYAEFPPFKLTNVQVPEVYKWLASQPQKFPIVEYPLGAGDDPYTTYEYSFYQRVHNKYLVNGAIKGTAADKFREGIIDISKGETIDKLLKIGVKYILIHRDKYIKGNEYVPLDWLTQPPRDKLFPVEYNDGRIPDLSRNKMMLVKDFGDVVVYEPR